MAGQSWRLCAKWLIDVGALPQTATSRVGGDGAQVLDLANLLRDGVVLCQLLNFLRPMAVDLRLVSLRSNMSLVRHIVECFWKVNSYKWSELFLHKITYYFYNDS